MWHHIGGSRGGVPGARPPRVQILSFQHTKFSKLNRLGSPRPLPPRGPRPLGEIMDPPLHHVSSCVPQIFLTCCHGNVIQILPVKTDFLFFSANVISFIRIFVQIFISSDSDIWSVISDNSFDRIFIGFRFRYLTCNFVDSDLQQMLIHF